MFRTEYDNMQIVSAPAFAFGAPWFFNAGEARIQGIEVEADAQVGPDLTLNASVGYLDAEYTELADVALAGGLTTDNMLMNVPEWCSARQIAAAPPLHTMSVATSFAGKNMM